MYKSFFGLKEAKINISADQLKDPNVQNLMNQSDSDSEINITEEDLAEADLTNQINDYRGGVVYTVIDPTQASIIAKTIRRWTAKKGFTMIKHEKSPRGTKGYFYFRLGTDPGTEAQRIQGYFAQLPGIKHFEFRVLDSEAPVKKRPNI